MTDTANKIMTSRELLDLACQYSLLNTHVAVTLAMRAHAEFRPGIDDPVVLNAARAFVEAMKPFTS